jgi:hypothetical protein
MTSDGRADCTHDRRCCALFLLATFARPAPGRGNGAVNAVISTWTRTVRVRAASVERSTGKCSPARPSLSWSFNL